jgi:rod shape-determining protein MreC
MIKGFNHKLEQQPAPAFFVRGPSSFARLAFFSALSIALIATDSRLQYLTALRQDLVGLLKPLQTVANAPTQLYRNTDEYFTAHHNLLNENRQFKQQLLKQDIALQRLSTLMLENEHLRNLLQANKALEESSIVGEIVHIGRDPFTKKVIVNRGANDNVVAGAAVVDAVGVIGQVTRTYSSSSEVTLITDTSLAIPIQVERNGLRAIAFGHGRDQTLDLPFLPANVDIRRGDVLVTSGIDGVYPAGLKVGSVTQVKVTADSPFARIVCVPTGGVENHSQVLLVSLAHGEMWEGDEVIATPKPSTKKTRVKSTPTPNNPSKIHAPQ